MVVLHATMADEDALTYANPVQTLHSGETMLTSSELSH